tara:strand:- start:180 stop:440 length:261 start_codon:yes stop_codon:yes gene_type:complete
MGWRRVPRWIIQYIFEDAKGKTRISLGEATAETKEEALELAAKSAPREEFLVSVHPESDEQFLGTVKHKAMIMSGKKSEIKEDDGD